MKYKAILLDIDNTLYEYEHTHKIAIQNAFAYLSEKNNFLNYEINDVYEKARSLLHIELAQTAASHNRLLYFQKMCEILMINPLLYAFKMENIYWESFINHMKPFAGLENLLEKYKNRICLVTDLTSQIQYKKILQLNIAEYCQLIVTSEEAGIEKPHPYIFLLALHKLNLRPNEVCMIGDSFRKDICGAINLGIDAIWFNHENKIEKYQNENIREIFSLNELELLI